jgi:hypothetical protein
VASAYEIGYRTALEDRSVVVLLPGEHEGQRCVYIRSYPCSPPMRERIRMMAGFERAELTVQLALHCATDARKAGVWL